MQEHVREHGRYPSSLLATRPADAQNLPYAPAGGVTLHVLPREDGYEATARYEAWTCWMSVSESDRTVPDCFPR